MTSCFVYKVIRDLESSDLSIRVILSQVYTFVLILAIVKQSITSLSLLVGTTVHKSTVHCIIVHVIIQRKS